MSADEFSAIQLYRMGITKYLTEIKKDFEVYGMRNEEWETFNKGVEYEAFLYYENQGIK
ncbi:DUF6934 family protein [Pedobacter heparinus]|uniref:Uncharacterized protein n=1 Tax=Pedobacter heparinus (strain ATCC 13125 / DSM 2366 / CIP 104194 / JCM 7457 / NBRC 12017 / NCIMB 9290 / NRRL B-14731 / HIM 762-3) TaxID=485917 RepID=C6XV93_PEDHD|nr:hypothetical protein [Pedobacter heparinus]ACU03959.1 hypothetical protein Phep_1750 [Pedobacter heparinus DSM 2366]